MANKDNPRGFWPIRHYLGGEIRLEEMHIDATASAGAIGKGDLITLEAGGNIDSAAADAGVIVGGVFWGCRYIDADSNIVYSDYIPATKTGFTDIVAYCYTDPFIVFGVQADSGTALTIASVFNTANHVATAPSSTAKRSRQELDASDVGTGAQLSILGLVDRPDNVWGEHADLEVLINEHARKAAVAGI